jgi:AmpD protein
MHPNSLNLSLELDAAGWCPQACQHPSPNYNARPPLCAIELLVIHNISLPPGQFGGPYIADLFGNQLDINADASFASLQGVKVSSHFLIRRDGSLLQFVSTLQRAWHAGASHFEGRSHCNDYSIGIELEGSDFVPFEDAQYNRLVELTYCLQTHHPLLAVCGHQHIAPGRKTDPGPCFNWPVYHSQWMALGGLDSALSGLRFPSPA